MKIKSLEEFYDQAVCCREHLVISVADFEFQRGWEPLLFEGICSEPVSRYSYVDDDSPIGVSELGFFKISPSASVETIINLIRHQSVCLLVCGAHLEFFESLPVQLTHAVCNPLNEITDDVLCAASTLSHFKWMAIKDGDVGDTYYHILEPST